FVDNTFESIDVNNLGAFYNNDEGDFKSRTGKTAPNPSGPFQSGTRRRNAQRLASRNYYDGGFPLPPAASGPGYLYPGVGLSTFRITTETFSGTNTILNSDGTT